MRNKNENCYNIEWNIKYSSVISMFSQHITIFGTFSIDIWQLKCQQRQTNKTKNDKLFFASFSELSNFFSLSFWRQPLWNQKLLLLTVTALRFCYTLVRPFTTLSSFLFFLKNFVELIFVTKINTILLKQSAILLTCCQKNIAYTHIMCLNT